MEKKTESISEMAYHKALFQKSLPDLFSVEITKIMWRKIHASLRLRQKGFPLNGSHPPHRWQNLLSSCHVVLWAQFWSTIIQMKATGQCFHVVLFIMLYKLIITF